MGRNISYLEAKKMNNQKRWIRRGNKDSFVYWRKPIVNMNMNPLKLKIHLK